MSNKSYLIHENEPMTANELVVAYPKVLSSSEWNPNVPFHGTQEEWWEHIHSIEAGEFYPVSETHQRVSQWLYNQKK